MVSFGFHKMLNQMNESWCKNVLLIIKESSCLKEKMGHTDSILLYKFPSASILMRCV